MHGRMNSGFIEDDFLGKTPKDLRKRRAASESNSEISSSLRDRTKAKKTQRLQKTLRSASKSMTLESSPSITEKAQGSIEPNNRKPSESIIWDIERESVILPSNHSTSVPEEVVSVLVDTKNTSWNKAPVDLAAPLLSHQRSPALHSTIQSDDTEQLHKSPSIGPSESASQYVNTSPTRRDPPAVEAASKYFASAAQPQPSDARLPSKGATSKLESEKGVVIESLAGDFMHTSEKHEDMSLALSSDVTVAQAQDGKRHAAICGSHLVDLDDLPFVEPQDYKYSDHSFQIGPSEDLDCYEVLQAMIPSYSVLDELDDERAHDENFFLHQYQWDVPELAYQPQELEETGYEEQHFDEEENLDDDEYDASECEDKYIIPSRAASQVRNRSLIHNADWNMEELGYQTGHLWQGKGEANLADHFPISVGLDTCIDYDLEVGQSADLIGTFTEGKALLRGYSEPEARIFHSSTPCQQIQLSGAEADVLKRLKNHWLPQRL
ncbi:hypothetical protein C0993_004356 [Termitomyces sp. T159_Od127]|nr:hypothetical protein C0993_004356 [Termitomyces sp. T159_Od127]